MESPPHFFNTTSHFGNVHPRLNCQMSPAGSETQLFACWLIVQCDRLSRRRLKYRRFEAVEHSGCLSMCLQNVTMPTLLTETMNKRTKMWQAAKKTNQIFFWLNVSSSNWSLQRKPRLMDEILWNSWRLHMQRWQSTLMDFYIWNGSFKSRQHLKLFHVIQTRPITQPLNPSCVLFRVYSFKLFSV